MMKRIDFQKVKQEIWNPDIPEEIRNLLYALAQNPSGGFTYKVSCNLKEAFRPIDLLMLKDMVNRAKTETEGTLIDRIWNCLYYRNPNFAGNLPEQVDFCEDNTRFDAFLKQYASGEARDWFIRKIIANDL